MKLLFITGIFFCFLTGAAAAELPVSSYGGQVLTEDTTWSGTVVVKGSVVVAPQATLRIVPGTVVRFVPTALQPLPNLVVQGRINVVGTAERPVTMLGALNGSARSSWGGLILLASEKKNLIEQCRIESAETAIDLRFSTLTLKATAIVQATTALLAYDSVLHLIDDTMTDCDLGISAFNSELDGKNVTIASCQRGGGIHPVRYLPAWSQVAQ